MCFQVLRPENTLRIFEGDCFLISRDGKSKRGSRSQRNKLKTQSSQAGVAFRADAAQRALLYAPRAT